MLCIEYWCIDLKIKIFLKKIKSILFIFIYLILKYPRVHLNKTGPVYSKSRENHGSINFPNKRGILVIYYEPKQSLGFLRSLYKLRSKASSAFQTLALGRSGVRIPRRRRSGNPWSCPRVSSPWFLIVWVLVVFSDDQWFVWSVEMAGIPGPLVWEIVKKNNAFLVKQFGNGNAKVQFSKEPNNLYNVHSYKHSGA